MFRKSIYSDDDIQFHIYLMSDGSRSFFFGFLANDSRQLSVVISNSWRECSFLHWLFEPMQLC